MAVQTLRRLASLVTHPVLFSYTLQARVRPEALWRRYRRNCERSGIMKPTFVLSFDCDTEADADVVLAVHDQLADVAIQPAYAVPGALLRHGERTYGRIAESGAEFLNHGNVQHTHFVDGKYVSSFFYDQLDRPIVEADIRDGHQAVTDVTGREPVGFRTPHFGSFQAPPDLAWLHGLLRDMGYRYSTSTMPLVGFRFGPRTERFGLPELPVTGCPSWPLGILDSYSFRFSPGRRRDEEDYLEQAAELAAWLERGEPILVNIYADPSQVHDWPPFFELMRRFAPFATGSFVDLLDSLVP